VLPETWKAEEAERVEFKALTHRLKGMRLRADGGL